jgi:hypothetical protein
VPIVVYSYLSLKECNLFVCLSVCQVETSQTTVPFSTLGTVGKHLMSRGKPSWFHNVSTCSEVIEY